MPDINAASRTEKGRRPANEDSCAILTSAELNGIFDGVYIVADGMGGRMSGSVASSTAIGAARDALTSMASRGAGEPADMLARMLRAANEAVYREASSRPELQGMGTTCVVTAVRGERAYYAHLGDSRAYVLRDGRMVRLTDDHSIVGEKVKSGEMTEDQARKSRFRNVITKAVGLEASADPDVGSTDLRAGDVLLLCTDGLTTAVPDSRIADVLLGSSDTDEACEQLIDTALKNGSSDNVTVVVAAYGPRQRRPVSRGPSDRHTRRFAWVLPSLISLVLGLVLGIYPGHTLYSKLVKQAPKKRERIQQIDLTRVVYEDPIPLLYQPVQGKYLTLDRRGAMHIVDTQGRLMKVDSTGGVAYTYPGRELLKPRTPVTSPMLASDRQGNLYMSDPISKRISKFGPDGLFIMGIGEGKLSRPEALAVDDTGAIFVIDADRLKVIRARPPVESSAGGRHVR